MSTIAGPKRRRASPFILALFALLVAVAHLSRAAPRIKDASAPDARALASTSAAALASTSAAASASASTGLAATSASSAALASASPSVSASTAPPAPTSPPAAASPPTLAPEPTALSATGSPPHRSPFFDAPPASVHIHDHAVFVLKAPRGGQSAAQRAHDATEVLERAIDEHDEPQVRVEEKDGTSPALPERGQYQAPVAIIYAGQNPVIQLGQDDADAAGDATLSVHAATVASLVRDAIRSERRRSALARTVFSLSLLVVSGLLAFSALKKLGELVDRGRGWIVKNPHRLPQLRIANIEVLHRASLRGGLLVVIDAAKWLLRLGIAYFWLLFVLSRFDATRSYGEKLGGFVLAPVSSVMGRAASALPMLIVLAIAWLAVLLLVRFVGLFFGSLARGETTLEWVPVDLAAPTSLLLRGGIVLAAIVMSAPLVSGAEDSALARAGVVALVAVGLATTPLLASAAVGVAVVYGRRLKVGEFAEIGGRAGIVRQVTLFEVSVEDDDGCDVRVPHLATLIHPTRLLGPAPPVRVELTVEPAASSARVLAVLTEAAASFGPRSRVDLVSMDARGSRYSVTIYSAARGARTVLACAAADALQRSGLALARDV